MKKYCILLVTAALAIVHRVRIEYGNTSLGSSESGTVDVSVMDDFIYGEPQEAK
ncbi:MAG: hypothetical protein SH848_08385 [Saprospiraceae bacterium]|nr:hypothetical protein [Saprospiraceae bacterium]MDZ4703932.1 hypothetical protein [Saprospiraceae bacterium]